jgi:hypothetical protein
LRQPRWPRRTQTNLPPANPGRFTGLLDQGLSLKDDEKVKKALQALAHLNKRFMLLASKRFAEMVSNEW